MFRTAFGDDTDSWFSQFKSQKTSAAECEHSGHLSTDCTTENVDRGIKTSSNDWGTPISWNASRKSSLYGRCQQILSRNLNMHLITAQFVPLLRTYKQKQWCMFVCQKVLKSEVIKASSWGLQQKLKPKFIVLIQKSSNSALWERPTPPCWRKLRQVRMNINSMLIFFFFWMRSLFNKNLFFSRSIR